MRKLWFGCVVLLLAAFIATPAVALDVDFDAYLFEVELFLGSGFELRDLDNDSNGFIDQDQLGMLSAILDGGAGVDDLDPIRVQDINAGYLQNFNAIPGELTVNIPSQGTVNLISELQGSNPALAVALQNLLAGYLTIADTTTITFINSFADQVIVKVLSGTPAEDDISNVQNQITFTALGFATFGDAPNETNFFGADADIDDDVFTNLHEYTNPANQTREGWLADCMIDPPLRIASLVGGGTRVSGLSLDFSTSAAGGVGGETFSWQKGSPGSSTVVSNTSSYSVPFANTSDSGGYFCVITDGVTTRTTPVLDQTVVYVPLFISQNISGGSKQVGTNKTFTVSVQGGSPGPYVYSWTKDGSPIGTDAPTLALTNLQVEDSGQYSVSVTSNGGGDSKTSGPATLTVVSPDALFITQQPVDASKALGENHTFTLSVTGGSGNYSYDWKKGGVSLGAADEASLTVFDISLEDEGLYRCTVTDVDEPTDEITSSNARLTVSFDPLAFTTEPASVTKGVGESHTFTVALTGGSGQYDYEWRRNGSPLGAPNQPTLTLVDIQLANAGNYRCKVTDQIFTSANITSGAGVLTVEEPPLYITTQPVGATKFVGDSYTISVVAAGGSGNYNYDWRVDGESLCVCDAASVNLSPLTVSDSGSYQCIVTDADSPGVEAITDSVDILVAEHLSVAIAPDELSLYSGQSAELSVSTEGGFAPFDFEWRYEGAPIVGAPNAATLPVGPVDLVDAGDYSCVVSGQVESMETDAVTLTVDLVSVPEGGASFNVDMTPDLAVPPHSSNGFGRTQGTITATAKGTGANLFISLLHNVDDSVTIGIFEGGPEVNGDLLVLLGSDVFSLANNFPLTDEVASKILAGYAYVAVTDEEYPNGDIRAQLFPEIGGEGEDDGFHSADQDGNLMISLSELLRVIQFFNLNELHCDEAGEDGYAPGPGDQSCTPHDTDYSPQDWSVNLSETLRCIQFYNSPGRAYYACPGESEDGYCPGFPPL